MTPKKDPSLSCMLIKVDRVSVRTPLFRPNSFFSVSSQEGGMLSFLPFHAPSSISIYILHKARDSRNNSSSLPTHRGHVSPFSNFQAPLLLRATFPLYFGAFVFPSIGLISPPFDGPLILRDLSHCLDSENFRILCLLCPLPPPCAVSWVPSPLRLG